MTAAVVDLFCGAGGLARGFADEQFLVVGGVDMDPACEYAFTHNSPTAEFVRRDVTRLSGADVAALYPSGCTKVLAGCVPCQPFSTYSQGKEYGESEAWNLLRSFSRIVQEVHPDLVTMENVMRIKRHGAYIEFVQSLKDSGYWVTTFGVAGPDYGVPQTRRRLVLFASPGGPVRLAPKTHSRAAYRTVRQTIGHLAPLEAGGASLTDPLHVCSAMSEKNLQRIKASVPGGTWRSWDKRLLATCHSRETGQHYVSVYGRMEWDAPAPTVTTQFYGFGNGRFGHPAQDRAISLKEGALLQTFCDDFQFVEPGGEIHMKVVGRLIGNAVPIQMARAVARSIRAHLEGSDDD
jgi:DNA (cytosine-5)-methyltransferase 1